MRRVPLHKVAEVNPRIPTCISRDLNRLVSFVPMAGVSETGIVTDAEARPLKEVIKGYRYFEEGDITHFVAIKEDITEGKRTHKELLRLASFPQENPNPILECNSDGNIVYANPAAQKIMYWGKGMPSLQILPENHKDLIRTCFKDQLNVREIEVKAQDRVYLWDYHPVPNLDVIHLYGADITNRKKASEQIKASLREKEILLKEIYHRTKNNMQVICSLLNLQSNYIKDEQTLSIFKGTQNRIKSMALVHAKLYESKDLSMVNLKSYILDVAIGLLKTYLIDKILFKCITSEIFVTIDTAIPFGLIINEIITNSLKHAFPFDSAQDWPDDRKGEIRIDLYSTDKGEIVLRIADNGIGMPEGFDLNNTGTLGLQIVSSLVDQLNGKYEINCKNGVEFLLKFREQRYAMRV